MNILMFVMGMMMVLGIMTYSKFNMFQSDAIVKMQFENYMQFTEHKYLNKMAEKLYNDIHVQEKENNNERRPRNTNISKIPILILLNPRAQEINIEIEKYQAIKTMLKQLIQNLYSKEPFFLETQTKKGDFVEEIINTFPSAMKDTNGDLKKMKRAKELAEIDLNDADLNKAFYKMLKGASFPEQTKTGTLIKGYPSLAEFLDVRQNKKMRAFLIPKEIVQVIFNQSVVDDIIHVREQLYKQVCNKELSEQEATEKFKSMFEEHINSFVPKILIDFSVTCTNPKKYA